MANLIQHKRSSTSGVVPTSGNLSYGELGINYADGKLYTKRNDNSIINLAVSSISGTVITPASGYLQTIQFNTNVEPDLLKGQVCWNDTDGTLNIAVSNDTDIHVGEHRFYRVRNSTVSILYKGQAVYATGVHANGIINPSLYTADGSVREIRFMGLMLEDLAINNNGYAIDFGHLNIDTRGNVVSPIAVGDETWAAGDILYIHPTVAGKLTKVEPKHSISVAIVLSAASNGLLFVRPTSYGHLDDNHDVNTSGVSNNQYLIYNSGTQLWVPTSSGTFSSLNVESTSNINLGTAADINIDFGLGNIFQIGSENIPRVTILGNGNVGIGATNPTVPLEVTGEILAQEINIESAVSGATLFNIEGTNGNLFSVVDSVSGSLMSVNDITGLPAFEVFSDHSVVAGRFNANDFVISSGGNVGIGTATPSGKLHVEATGINVMVGPINTWTNGGKLRVYGDDTDNQNQAIKAFVSRASTGLNICLNGTSYTIAGGGSGTNIGMYGFAGNGNKNYAFYGDAGYNYFSDRVGIGILDPSGLFHINGGVGSDYSQITLTSSGLSTTTHIGIGNSDTRPFLASLNGNLSSSIYGWGFFDRGTDGNFQIRRKGGTTSWNDVLTIQRSNGNIGIGASSPSTLLDVSGVITATGGNSTNWNTAYGWGDHASAGYQSVLTNPVTGTGEANHIAYWNGTNSIAHDSNQLVWNATNNLLGVGLSTPSEKIHVSGAQTTIRLNNSLSYDTQLRLTDTASDWSVGINQGNSLGSGVFSIRSVTAGASRLVIGTNGNVGIGTTSPGGNVSVIGAASAGQIGIHINNTSTNGYSVIRLGTDSVAGSVVNIHGFNSSWSGTGAYAPNACNINNTTGAITLSASNVNGSIQFYTAGTAVANERLRITNTGNVGIGTSSPSQKLDVVGIGKFGEASDVVYVGNDNIGGEIGISTTSDYIAAYTTVDSKFRYGGNGSTTIGIVIDSSQNVGIGTESPSYKLQVNGSFGATTKSFRIDHPSRPNYTLEYGSLESPYHGVRLTGRGKVVKGSGTVLLPSYLKDLIHDDENINIQITNIKHGKTIYVDNIDLNNDQFTVRVDRAKTLGTLEFFWTFTGTRKDVDKLVVEREK